MHHICIIYSSYVTNAKWVENLFTKILCIEFRIQRNKKQQSELTLVCGTTRNRSHLNRQLGVNQLVYNCDKVEVRIYVERHTDGEVCKDHRPSPTLVMHMLSKYKCQIKVMY